MGKVFEEIDEALERWISEQVMFFVGSAPDEGGHVNVSPKAPIESFVVVDPHTVAYLDLLGSGIETVAHARQNGRICIMFCAFDGRPRIVRLHGQAEVLQAGSPEFEQLLSRFDRDAIPGSEPGMRSLVRVAVARVSDSCGFDVPLMRLEGRRPQRMAWLENRMRTKGVAALGDYVADHNEHSIDGLPGIDPELTPLIDSG
ncbi:MAG TPA: pyridoxamine 5'-phosphate oxidase family protein [Gaiellales bacterium]|nr:pyridoxamine 5'-phosphate oxidase family protein [Gaiellales bacterium]